MDIKDFIENRLPELRKNGEKLNDAVSFLTKLGVNNEEDMNLLEQSDLMPFFNLVQSRKLLQAYRPTRSKCQSNHFCIGMGMNAIYLLYFQNIKLL